MNGAMAELCAMISSIAKMPRVIRIGVIHQRLLFQKKANNSPAIPKRCPVVRKKPIALSLFLEPNRWTTTPVSVQFSEFAVKAIHDSADGTICEQILLVGSQDTPSKLIIGISPLALQKRFCLPRRNSRV